jgi:hypothetical protein
MGSEVARTNGLQGDVLPAVPERLETQGVTDVANAVGEHFEILGGDHENTGSAKGATRRLIAGLVAAGELRPDFDAQAIVAQLDVIKGGGQ